MSRLQGFREIRVTRRRYILSMIIFFMLLISGICISDYSINSILKNEKHIEVLSFKNIKNEYLEINLMNRKYYIKTKYLIRDYQKVKKELASRFSQCK